MVRRLTRTDRSRARVRRPQSGIPAMTSQEVMETLLPHRQELEKEGVTGLLLFGSVARGDQNGESDVDLAAEWSDTPTLFRIGGVQIRLEMLLGVPVDLAYWKGFKSPVRE